MALLIGQTNNANENAVFGRNDATSAPPGGGGVEGTGVFGLSISPGAAGVFGANNSAKGVGVHGSGPEVGVRGFSDQGSGMLAQSNKGSGLVATSDRGQGMSVFSSNDIAIFARGATFSGVFEGALVVNKGPDPVDGSIAPNRDSGSVIINDGSLIVQRGDVILSNADCAEDFDIADPESVEPGTVMVLGEEGALHQSQQAYDKRVAGVISGAGDYKPGIVLDKQHQQPNRKPIALLGKVYCKVDASEAPIEVGDLLTTSDRPGHAMKAANALDAFGSIIGKALRPFKEGQGLIPILIALQ